MTTILKYLAILSLLFSHTLTVKITSKVKSGKARLEEARKNFNDFALKTQRNYQSNSDFKKARRNYIRNAARVAAQNKRNQEGDDAIQLELNDYADMTGQEFVEYFQLEKQAKAFEDGAQEAEELSLA